MTDDSVVSISDVVSGTFGSPRASYYSGAERSSGAGDGSLMDVSEHSVLGRGVFGVVYKDHLPVAVKKIRNYGLNAVKEVEVLKELSHVNIIRYYSHHTEDGGQNLCIIMEYADLGTLSSLIREEAQTRSLAISRKNITGGSCPRPPQRWSTYTSRASHTETSSRTRYWV